MEWLIFALLSAVSAAFVAIFGKIGIEDIDPTAATIVRAAIMFGVVFVVGLFTGRLPDISAIDMRTFSYILLSGVAGGLSWIFYFIALRMGKASMVAPIDRLSMVFTVVLAALILGEKVTRGIAVGTILMVIGAILVVLG
ncbi:MAG: EamA family transporter [Candidatus Bathyarchaeota archaeon]|nr:MAG: EamA family transporter [Candidatus Bathyarchaeota archaeon]